MGNAARQGARKRRNDGGIQAMGDHKRQKKKAFLAKLTKSEQRQKKTYADKLYPLPESTEASGDQNPVPSDEDDVAAALSKEIADVKGQRKWRAELVDTEIQGIVLAKLPGPEDPVVITQAIMNDLHASKEPRSRFVVRLLPILNTVSLKPDAVAACVTADILPHFTSAAKPDNEDQPITFSVEYKARLNSQADRLEVINMVASPISKAIPQSKVNLDNPDIAVLANVFKVRICLGVAPDYRRLRKYNLHELVKQTADEALSTE